MIAKLKDNWPDKLFKIIVSILSIVFGAHEYQIHTAAEKAPVIQYFSSTEQK